MRDYMKNWWGRVGGGRMTRMNIQVKVPQYTAISRKVVGKSARDNPDRYCGRFWVHCSSKKFERIAREAIDRSLRVLREGSKSRFDSYSRQEQCIDQTGHITIRGCRVHISLSDNSSWNSCVSTDPSLINNIVTTYRATPTQTHWLP